MKFIKISDGDKIKYMDFLLIADEQQNMIEKYLYRGEMFALCDEDEELKAFCVVTAEQPGVYEIKNIVTIPEYQRRGYGKSLVAFIAEHYRQPDGKLYVGTGDCGSAVNFYEKCGFSKSHIVKNFFTDNYAHPIYEDGKQLIDMVYLKMFL